MSWNFLKMHGLGNDFVVIDGRGATRLPDEAEVRAIGDRRKGVGFDQLVVIAAPTDPAADAFMHIRNPDGSVAGACGNATRCVARLLMEATGRDRVVVQTISGLLPAEVAGPGLIAVDMGPARLDWREVPLAGPMETLALDLEVEADGVALERPVAVGMGNPHAVFFVPDVAAVPLERLGPLVEHHPLFPERTNVEIVEILSDGRLRMRVWERSAGITMACGSGACAVLVAAARRGLTPRRNEVVLDGGSLILEWREDGHVIMTGPTAVAFSGRLDPALFAAGGAPAERAA